MPVPLFSEGCVVCRSAVIGRSHFGSSNTYNRELKSSNTEPWSMVVKVWLSEGDVSIGPGTVVHPLARIVAR